MISLLSAFEASLGLIKDVILPCVHVWCVQLPGAHVWCMSGVCSCLRDLVCDFVLLLGGGVGGPYAGSSAAATPMVAYGRCRRRDAGGGAGGGRRAGAHCWCRHGALVPGTGALGAADASQSSACAAFQSSASSVAISLMGPHPPTWFSSPFLICFPEEGQMPVHFPPPRPFPFTWAGSALPHLPLMFAFWLPRNVYKNGVGSPLRGRGQIGIRSGPDRGGDGEQGRGQSGGPRIILKVSCGEVIFQGCRKS